MRPLAALIKHVGRGARLARDLELDEARQAMRLIATGEADPVQTGAFLLAMRMKSESAAEIAGFTLALREVADVGDLAAPGLVDLDLHADGRAGRPSIALAAACIAAACGARVLVRGWFGSPFARNDVGGAFARLGVDPGRGPAAARRGLQAGVAVLDLDSYAPRIAGLLGLRALLSVRTCVSSAVKLLDPANARRHAIGIFHSPYHAPMAGAARLLGAERAAVVQAAGGVPELAPDRPTRVSRVEGGDVRGPDAFRPGGEAPAALPSARTAAELAALLEAVLAGRGPEGAARASACTAALLLWIAGRGVTMEDPALISAAYEALAAGRAARVLDDVRLCYRA